MLSGGGCSANECQSSTLLLPNAKDTPDLQKSGKINSNDEEAKAHSKYSG